MNPELETLKSALHTVLGERVQKLQEAWGELTLTVALSHYLEVARLLQSHPSLAFEQLVDLCGLDYANYKDGAESVFTDGPRFAVVSHLLSFKHNWRLRVRVFAGDDDVPVVPSLSEIWAGVNWFEREAFDLFGILFEGHNDLRRILTDYGFVGHPFRKDFPTTGYVEMRYDAEQRRVIYQPVTIEPREITPRIVREDNYGGLH